MNILFPNTTGNVFLAPMAGVTDRAFRAVCMQHGADLTYTEMVSAQGLMYHNRHTFDLLASDGPFAAQLFGKNPEIISSMAARVCQLYAGSLVLIDLNMGCPAPKIVKNGEGSALMLDLPLAASIIRATKKAVNVPLTVKFRAGFDAAHKNAREFALMAQDSGADAVCIHGRTREQMYAGKADWDVIADVKSRLAIPVIGNGDVTDATAAKAMRDYTRCDAIMIGRGALGNPFLFAQITHGTPAPTLEARIQTALSHFDLCIRYKGEDCAVREFRKHAMWYVHGIPNATKLRQMLCKAANAAKMRDLLHSLQSSQCQAK